MKITFIYLGILVTMFSNSIFTYDLTNKQNYQEINSSEMSFVSLSNGTKLKKPALTLESDTIITMIANDIKTMEEVIAEDNKIIESEIKNNPTSEMESTIEEVIKQDNQIIESNLTNEELPLDFDSINRK
jgi:tyrosine-protein phosphatase YwqE